MSLQEVYLPLIILLREVLSPEAIQQVSDEIEAAFSNKQEDKLVSKQHGDLQRWQQALANLPTIKASIVNLQHPTVIIGHANDCDAVQGAQLEQALREFHPWRKGPFSVFGIEIETEWRSDSKWDRLAAKIAPLKNRRVLDVGCGNGYHCWRMAGEGASLTLGIDPTLVFVMQYHALRTYLPALPVYVAPLSLENMPPQTAAFDTVFSMGVLYHRRSPLEHLDELYQQLRPGGELVLETLVIDSKEETVLTPEGRYAMMRNVWFIPSCSLLIKWLTQSGFINCRLIDVSVTTIAEQHSTDWMRFDSLPDFLDAKDHSKTVEGYPAPCRAIILANRPSD